MGGLTVRVADVRMIAMQILGGILIGIGILLIIMRPRIKLEIARGKVRGLAGPILVILGILMLVGVISV